MKIEDRLGFGFGIYIHWPFCQAKCPYCDFNSHVADTIDETRWLRAYLAELQRTHSETPDRIVTSVFFGGGTPSLMSPELVGKVIEEIRRLWRTSNDIEITLEANPTSSEAGKFRGFRDAGINRLSMGIQALNNPDLKALGRLHTAEEGMKAFKAASAVFDRVSFDLIYARQNQTLEDWKAELTFASKMAVDHFSLYQLTIEDGTAFGARFDAGKLRGLPTDDLSADMYEVTQEITDKAGLNCYETSNHARPGSESRHNLIYWRGGDYLGIGPGAHGRITIDGSRFATTTELAPIGWLRQVEITGNGEEKREELSQHDQLVEYILMSARLSEGINRNVLASFANQENYLNNINKLIEDGFLVDNGDTFIIPTSKRILTNAIIREMLA